jgi:reactive intermediate/imine deaminase
MKKLWLFVMPLAVWFGCGPSEDEVRALVQAELARASTVEHITDASVIGPYSPATRVGRFLFVSGQIGMDPETMQLAGIDIESQTRRALDNLMVVLGKAGYDSSDVVQCTVFLKEINDYQKMNLIYGGYFAQDHYPARMAVEVSDLPRSALVEISAIAYKRLTL